MSSWLNSANRFMGKGLVSRGTLEGSVSIRKQSSISVSAPLRVKVSATGTLVKWSIPPRGMEVESKRRCQSVASLAFVPMMSGPPEILKYLSTYQYAPLSKAGKKSTNEWLVIFTAVSSTSSPTNSASYSVSNTVFPSSLLAVYQTLTSSVPG